MYNDLENTPYTGLIEFINDLNTRFTNLLFKDLKDSDNDYKANHLGLARLDFEKKPMALAANGDYEDSLVDDNYYLVSSFIDSGARKDGEDSQIDLLVSVNMNKFTGFTQEGIINEFFQVMKVTSFEIETTTRDLEALKGMVYDNIEADSMHPNFVFKISSKLLVSFN